MELLVDYVIMPVETVPMEAIRGYFDALTMTGRLGPRLCDISDPTPNDAIGMLARCTPHVYFLAHPSERYILAEFTLENFIGRSAQLHFSIHPNVSPQTAFMLGRTATDRVLHDWKLYNRPYLDSLYGLTPTLNRPACAFVQRCGFKKLGVLRGAQHWRGEPCDAMITTKAREIS
jgi:hypothetical protein